ncbi:MAG: hypothetical protein KDA25_03620 [Phycisphaerales bacterium]|nr:hypothetical protein [Phycisphaerales bacterium]
MLSEDAAMSMPLSVTIMTDADGPRGALNRLAAAGYRYVQLSATMPGLRPRELDGSARRGLVSALRRLELIPSGLDLWIPPEHFAEAAHMDRAVAATLESIEFAATLRPCPISMILPATGEESASDVLEVIEVIRSAAERSGVTIADHAVPPASRPGFSVGLDPASWFAAGRDPVAGVLEVASTLASARLADLSSTTGLRGPVTGSSRLDVLAYRVNLTVTGYRGPVVIDTRQWADPWAGALATREAWSALG